MYRVSTPYGVREERKRTTGKCAILRRVLLEASPPPPLYPYEYPCFSNTRLPPPGRGNDDGCNDKQPYGKKIDPGTGGDIHRRHCSLSLITRPPFSPPGSILPTDKCCRASRRWRVT